MMTSFIGKATPINADDFRRAVAALGIDEATLWAVFSVETRGFGFLADRRPQILFERHIFHGLTGGRFSSAHPDISNRQRGGYAGGAGEYPRLARAMALDANAALQSASWGLGQIMGFNAVSSGFGTVENMVAAMIDSEAMQLKSVVSFIAANGALQEALKKHNWARTAFFYNGKDYAVKHYDIQLEQHYNLLQSPGRRPDVRIRTAQACLSFLGLNPKGVDGQAGTGFWAALNSYCAARGLAQPATLDDPLLTKLTMEAGI